PMNIQTEDEYLGVRLLPGPTWCQTRPWTMPRSHSTSGHRHMGISLTGTGGLYTRWGTMIGTVNVYNTGRGSTLDTRVSNLIAQFNTSERNVLDQLYAQRDTFRTSPATWMAYMQTLAQTTLVEMANNDSPLPSKTLAQAVSRLVTQMQGSGDTIA